MYASSCETRYEMNTMYKCGPDSQNSGDSACVLSDQVFIVKNLNATKNFGCKGAGSVSLFSPFVGTNVSYIQCSDIDDSNFFELWTLPNNISKCNFINKTRDNYIFWISKTTLTAIDCCFVSTPSVFVRGAGSIHFINCQSDVTYIGYDISSLVDVVPISVLVSSYEIVNCETIQNKMNYANFGFKSFIYSFLIISNE